MGPRVFSLRFFNLLFLLELLFFVEPHSRVTEHLKFVPFLLNQDLMPHATQEPSITRPAQRVGILSLGPGQDLKSGDCGKAPALAQPTDIQPVLV